MIQELATALTDTGGWRALLARMSSETRLYDLAVDGFAGALWIESFVGREALSELYDYRILALSTDVHLDLAALRWRRARLRIRLADGGEQFRSGYVRNARSSGSDGGLARYELHLAPWNWLLTQQSHSRIWQEQPLTDIVSDVFAAYADAQWGFAEGTETVLGALPVRPYCVQYRESDHDFIARLLAEEGLGWTYEESDEPSQSARLMIFADAQRFAEVQASDGIRFHRAAAAESADSIQRLAPVQRLPARAASVVAFDTATKRSHSATTVSSATHANAADAGTAAITLEKYRWSGHGLITDPEAAARRSRLMQQARDTRSRQFQASGSVRSLRAGRRFRLTQSLLDGFSGLTAPADDRRTLAVLSLTCAGINNLPAARTPAERALKTLAESAWLSAPKEDVYDPIDRAGLETLLAEARAHGYAGRMQLQPADSPWRPQSAGTRPRHTAPGTQSAVVVDAAGHTSSAEEIHRDQQGRIRVRFHWQQDAGNAAAHTRPTSAWLRTLSRSAGPGRGQSFVPRLGQEVLVGFLDGDIDQPIVLGALYNGRGEGGGAATPAGRTAPTSDGSLYAQAEDRRPSAQGNVSGGNSPAWHGHSTESSGHQNPAALSGFKTREFAGGGGGYNQLVLDDRDQRLRIQLKTTQATTELNLGHLIHQADNHLGSERGSGFEVRTDAGGAIRASRGVLVESRRGRTPANQPEPLGDFTAGVSLLQQAQALLKSFDAVAVTHQATGLSASRGSLKTRSSRLAAQAAPSAALTTVAQATVSGEDGSPTKQAGANLVPHLGAAIVALSAQAPLGINAGQALQLATGEALVTISGGDQDHAIGGRLTIHGGQSLGLLAGIQQNATNPALSLITAQGPLRLEAQNSTMNLDARQALKVVSVNQSLEAAAKTGITLTTKQGATIKIEGGNIQIHCPGQITVHAAQHQWSGPAQLSREMNEWPMARFDEKVRIVGPDEKPLPNYRYEYQRADGAKIGGITDSDGWAELQNAVCVEELTIRLLGPA